MLLRCIWMNVFSARAGIEVQLKFCKQIRKYSAFFQNFYCNFEKKNEREIKKRVEIVILNSNQVARCLFSIATLQYEVFTREMKKNLESWLLHLRI